MTLDVSSRKKVKRKFIFKQKRRHPIDVRNYKLLKSLNGDYNDRLSLNLKFLDGSTKVLPINNSFFYDKDSNLLNESKIIQKLNTIKHDFCAKEYKINKLF